MSGMPWVKKGRRPARMPGGARWGCPSAIGTILMAAALTLGSIAPGSAGAEPFVASEERVKAAYLYRLLGYVQWPPGTFASPKAPFVIGVMSAEGVAYELEKVVAGRTVDGRSVTVKTLRPDDAIGEIHVLFVGHGERARLRRVLRNSGNGILDVTESDGALLLGSMINFRIDGGRVRFEAAPDVAQRAELKMSAHLLGVAISVITGIPQ